MSGLPLKTSRDIIFAAEGRIGRLTFNRPDAGNRITDPMMQLLLEVLRAGDDLDVLVIDAAGPDFCLGRHQTGASTPVSRRASLGLAVEVNRALDAFEGMIVAGARGRALGFGCGLLVKSDLVLLGDRAVLGFDEIHHGFPPMIVMSYLARRIPGRHALELVATGREVSAQEAVAIGIASETVPADALAAEVDALVERLRALDLRAVTRAKSYLREIEDVPASDRLSYALEAQLRWFEAGQ